MNLCSFDDEPEYSFNEVEAEIHKLKKNFNSEDLPEVFKHKSQYLEYRSQTHGTFLSLFFFFTEAKILFDYFKDTQQNEFEAFETKAIPVNSIAEMAQGIKQGQTKFILPTNTEHLPPKPIVESLQKQPYTPLKPFHEYLATNPPLKDAITYIKKELIGNDRLPDAIEATITLAQEHIGTVDEAIALLARHTKNEEENRLGIITYENYQMTYNRIRYALQQYLNELLE